MGCSKLVWCSAEGMRLMLEMVLNLDQLER